MLVYLEYFVTWVIFMAIIAGLAIATPKLAALVDRKLKMRKTKKTESLFDPLSEEESNNETVTDEAFDSEQ